MSKNKWLWLSVVSALSGASVAAAHDCPHGCPHDMAKLDANGDGVVSAAEFETAAVARWSESDANHDGKVTADEMKAQCASCPMHDGGTCEPENFTKVDANSDGKIERSEVAKMPDPMFKKLDTNKDGSLSAAEFEKGHPGPHGKHAGEHAADCPMMAKGLPADTNTDGAVTKPEAQAEAQKMFKQIDANNDGKVTKDELANKMKMHGMPMHGEGGPGHGMHMHMHGDAGAERGMPMHGEPGHGHGMPMHGGPGHGHSMSMQGDAGAGPGTRMKGPGPGGMRPPSAPAKTP